jgi:hypothetical protein
MTSFAILRFLDLHGLMTAEALTMVRPQETWLVQLCLVERLAMTALTQRRLDTHWCMVMASLANRVLTTMEVGGYSTVSNVLHQTVDDLSMGEFYWFVLL